MITDISFWRIFQVAPQDYNYSSSDTILLFPYYL